MNKWDPVWGILEKLSKIQYHKYANLSIQDTRNIIRILKQWRILKIIEVRSNMKNQRIRDYLTFGILY